jgi:hypothetical protein
MVGRLSGYGTVSNPQTKSAATNTATRQESCAKFDRCMTFSLRLEGKPMVGMRRAKTYNGRKSNDA